MIESLAHKKHYNVPGHAHALTFTCYRRRHLFRDAKACATFLNELSKARIKHNLKIWGYVVMPNHVHALVWPANPDYDISAIQREIKSLAAVAYIRHVRESRPDLLKSLLVEDSPNGELRFWQRGGGFDRNLWKGLAVHEMIEYITSRDGPLNLYLQFGVIGCVN